MLTDYRRIMANHRKARHVAPAPPNPSVRLKMLEARLEREDARDLGEAIPGAVVALTASRAAQRDAQDQATQQMNELAE